MRRGKRVLLIVVGTVLGCALIVAVFTLLLAASDGRTLEVEKAGSRAGATLNLTEEDLSSLPALKEALEEANRTGHAAITDGDDIDAVCEFLRSHTQACGARVLYGGEAYKLGLSVT